MIFIILLLTTLTICYLWMKWRYSYWERRGVPGPKPQFPFGNMKDSIFFKEHFGLLCEKWYKEYHDAPYIGYFKMSEPTVLLRDKELIKDVLIKDFSSFEANDFNVNEKYDALLAVNPFFAVGPVWKRYRNLIQPLFSPSKIKILYPTMLTSCEKLIDYIKSLPKGKDVEAKSISAKYTTQNVIKCGFSMDAKCFEDGKSEFREIGKKWFTPSFLSALKFMLYPVLPSWLLQNIPISLMPREVEAWFTKIVKENKESRKANGVHSNDILQSLLDIQEKQNSTDVELAGHALSVFFEGFETSSTVLSFTLYELARRPDCQQRVYEEIMEVLEAHDKELTYEILLEMTYLESVVYESMRLNAVMLTNGKICTKPYTLPILPNQKEPVTIQPGTVVTVPTKAIHYDPDYYPDPEQFIPERFSEEERKNRHKSNYLPFIEGPRACPGMRFALAQVNTALVYVIKNFNITLSPNHKPFQCDPQGFLWQAKDGLLLNFAPRNE